MARRRTGGKGTFTDLDLGVAKRYLALRSRRLMVLAGAAAAAGLVLWASLSLTAGRAGFLSDGPLSSNHATLEGDCASCHVERGKVVDSSCAACHEKHGDPLGTYSFAAHFVYRSGDFGRAVPSEHEMACAACHPEHGGRDAEIVVAPDGRCLDCHDFGAFGERHPQFAFAANDLGDPAGLEFGHVRHTAEVMKQQELDDLEVACLYCHTPQRDGKSFEPISFERHCDACHLTATSATPRLPIGGSGGDEPGVETLEEILARGAPGTAWALFTNPAEFQRAGNGVRKVPVYHQDPWILENLRRLRGMLYPQSGLADLLRASADVPSAEREVLYREALATLEDFALGLRSRPEREIQEQLERIRGLIAEVERKLEDPFTPLDETKFLLALSGESALDAAATAAVEELIGDLTQPCTRCHGIEEATLERVQKDQRTLRRAEFNHRAHILQRRCLDCHTAIPIAEHLAEASAVEAAADRASIQNLPRIETCRTCHDPGLAADSCTTCHLFHPDEGRRADLLLRLDPREEP